MKTAYAIGALSLCAGAAVAQPILDGTLDASYGAPLSIQNTSTSFGNSTLGVVDFANGSELDGFYCQSSPGFLHLFFTGNLESNFNKFELFVDSKAGGQGTLRGDNPDVDFNGLNRMAGLTFDAGFEPDYWVSCTGGGSPYSLFANYAELLTTGGGMGGYLGSTTAASSGVLSGGSIAPGISMTINNSNVGGVGGGTGLDSGAGVTTGIEISIDLAALGGGDPGSIKLAAFINGGGHDFLSNQVLAGIGGGDHLGEPSLVNFNRIAGDQFVSIPAPGALALIGLGGLVSARRRRA
ncbi:MAG: PEP-CTERM sorting domain-containing protein [Phycisphaerales bacterium]|nr:PEP-CTERM sorting domain-containing protein [Phycisphaerales bacterium]